MMRHFTKILYLAAIAGILFVFIRWAGTLPNDQDSLVFQVAAQQYFAAGELDEALSEAMRAWKLDDQDAPFSYFIGIIYQQSEKLDSAIYWYSLSTKLDDKPPWTHYRLGVCLLMKRDTAGAVQSWLRSAERSTTDFHRAYISVGDLYRNQKRFDEAARILQHGLESFPQDYDVSLLIGLVLKEQNKYPEARNYFERCRSIDSTRFEAHYHLGILAYYDGDWKKADRFLSRALQINPSYSFSHYYRARSFQEAGKNVEAVKEFNEASTLNPFVPGAWLDLTKLYLKLGRDGDALQTLQRAQHEYPKDAALLDKLNALLSQGKKKMMGWFFHVLDRLKWRGILLLTAPVFAVIVLLVFLAVANNLKIATSRDDIPPEYKPWSLAAIRMSLHDQLTDIKVMFETKDIPTDTLLPVYRLYVNNAELDSLEADLPKSAFQYVKGYLQYQGKVHKVKVRYRGDNPWHWLYPKKSFRVKMKKSDILNGTRLLNFLAPKTKTIIVNSLADFYADRMGLLAPRSYFVRLYLNNKYMGLYQFLDQIDESFLRIRGRLPGNVYYGEQGIATPMWKDAKYWDKKAHVNSFPSTDSSDMQRLLDVVNKDSDVDFVREFPSIMNLEKYLKNHALAELAASMHQDFQHNHKYYDDPSNGLLEPIPWDLDGFGEQPYFNTLSYPLHPIAARVYAIPGWVQRKNTMLWNVIHSFGSTDEIYRVVDSIANLIRPDVYADGLKSAPDFTTPDVRNRPFTNKDFDDAIARMKGWISLHNEYLVKQLQHANAEVWVMPPDSSSSPDKTVMARVSIVCSGVSGVEFQTLTMNVKPGSESPGNFELWRDQNCNGIFDRGDVVVERGKPVNANTSSKVLFTIHDSLYPGRRKVAIEKMVGKLDFRYGRSGLRYDYFLVAQRGASRGPLPLTARGFEFGIVNLMTQSPEAPSTHVHDFHVEIPSTAATISLHPWKIPGIANGKTVVWQGTKTLAGTTTIESRDTLKILPGTIIKLDTGASVFSYGKVLALGSPSAHIVFEPLRPDQPWGVFALQDEASRGSMFQYCEFSLGSQAFKPRIYYSGMVEVRRSAATFRHCIFRRNKIADDTFHGVCSDVTIEECVFDHPNSDAVDFDICTGVIQNNRFYRSGNDAIDLMGSTPLIKNNFIEGSLDKGISVGEDSHPTIINNVIIRCEKGIQLKDASSSTIVNNVILNNNTGLDAYKKNWRYGSGGHGTVVNSIIRGNATSISFDKHSLWDISYCNLDTLWTGEHNMNVPLSAESLEANRYLSSNWSQLSAAGSVDIVKEFIPSFPSSVVPIGLIAALDLVPHYHFQAPPKGMFDSLYREAVDMMSRKMLSEAQTILRECAEIDSSRYEPLYQLGIIYNLKKDHFAARTMLLDALQKNPNDGQIEYQLGMAFAGIRRGNEAVDHLKRAITLMPSLEEGWIALIVEYRKMKMDTEADQILKQALDRFPADREAIERLSHPEEKNSSSSE